MYWKISGEKFNSYINELKLIITENEITKLQQDFENGKIKEDAYIFQKEQTEKKIARLRGLTPSDSSKYYPSWCSEQHAFSTCLAQELSDDAIICPEPISPSELIYPFGFNLSQKKATENALFYRASIIEGPPGTGKTQSILNIIANCIINGKTVAIASNNNSAVDNVLEKLKKDKLDFIAASLGNQKRNKEFDTHNPQYPEELSTWGMAEDEYASLRKEVLSTTEELSSYMQANNNLATARQELKQIETEYQYFIKYKEYHLNAIAALANKSVNNTPMDEKVLKRLHSYTSDELLDILINITGGWDTGIFRSLLYKLRILLKYGRIGIYVLKNPIKTAIYIKDSHYLRKIKELTKIIDDLNNELAASDFNRLLNENTLNSMRLFKAALYKRYCQDNESNYSNKRDTMSFKSVYPYDTHDNSTTSQHIYLKNAAKAEQSDIFLKEFPVIMSTTHSLRNILLYRTTIDLLIVDESSQVDIVTGAESMTCAKNAVLIGDIKQLPAIVTEQSKQKALMLLKEYKLPEQFGYIPGNSLLKSVIELLPIAQRVLLREHYRCAPEIIEFCNQRFYNGELIIMSHDNSAGNPHPMEVIITNDNGYDRYNRRNLHQVDAAIKDIIKPRLSLDPQADIGVIAPYVNQVEAFKEYLQKYGLAISAATVHSFQGRENDTIIFSSVENRIKNGSFPDDDNFINVAVSRAKKHFVLITEGLDHAPSSNVSALIEYIQYKNFNMTTSTIRSVFSCLHKDIDGKRQEYIIKNPHKFSGSAAEEIFDEQVLSPLFSSNEDGRDYNQFRVHHRYPLSQLCTLSPETIKDELSEKHAIFAFYTDSHIDFLIYTNEVKAVLAIEINGTMHNKQKRRQNDALKQDLLKLMNIPLLTLTTYGCEEKEKVIEALNKYYFDVNV